MSTCAITRRMRQVCRVGRSDPATLKTFRSILACVSGIIVGALFVLVVALVALVLRVRASEGRARRRGEALEAAERVARLGSFRLDFAKHETSWSDEMYRLQGLEPGDGAPSYERFLERVHPEDRDGLDQTVRASVGRGEPFDVDCRLLVPGHGERIVQCRGETVGGGGRTRRAGAVVGTVHDVTEARRSAAELEYRVRHDAVTDLANRRAVEDVIAAAIREHRAVAALVLNVRGFAGITRALGHEIGDRLLRAIADRLMRIGGASAAGRLGGDRFVLVVDPAGDLHSVVSVADGVRLALEPPVELDGLTLLVEASVGIAVAPGDAQDASELLRAAQAATERASERQQSYAMFSPESDAPEHGPHALLAAVRHAIGAGDLEVHYQPKLALDGRRIVAVEALVRWRRGRELVAPGEFLPHVERSGLIRDLTLHVLEIAARDCARWRADGLDLGMAVNLSAANLLDLEIAGDIARVLADQGLPPGSLELEVTESAFMVDPRGASGVLAGLRALGASLAIDDFGTGYSSLGLLREMPIDTLKIDRTFVGGMIASRDDEAIVRSVVQLSRELGLNVVAEGVEREAELDALTEFGCDLAQGFLIARPVPADELPAAVDAWEARAHA
jgi:diguanylate cyclase (GGDEF)-like protein